MIQIIAAFVGAIGAVVAALVGAWAVGVFRKKQDVPHKKASQPIVVVVLVASCVAISLVIGTQTVLEQFKNAAPPTDESNLISRLGTIRSAIDLYYIHHDETYPSLIDIEKQLTQYTNISGETSPNETSDHSFGPYLMQMPILELGPNSGSALVTDTPGDPGAGWVYDETTGEFYANTDDEMDDTGVLYSDY